MTAGGAPGEWAAGRARTIRGRCRGIDPAAAGTAPADRAIGSSATPSPSGPTEPATASPGSVDTGRGARPIRPGDDTSCVQDTDADGWYGTGGVPPHVRARLDQLTEAVHRDRRWLTTPQPVQPVGGLSPLAAVRVVLGGAVGPLGVAVGLVWRRCRLRRLRRRWSDQRILRTAVSFRWWAALDVLAAAESRLRGGGLSEQAATAAEVLDRALVRARAGTRLDREITRITVTVGAPADGDTADPDVAALRADVARAVDLADRLLDANTAAARQVAVLAAAAITELAARTGAVEAVRHRVLGALDEAAVEAAAVLPGRSWTSG